MEADDGNELPVEYEYITVSVSFALALAVLDGPFADVDHEAVTLPLVNPPSVTPDSVSVGAVLSIVNLYVVLFPALSVIVI